MSGAGYFALGLAAVSPAERGALNWCYDRFLADADAAAGTPYDTTSVYPQYAVAAFVNWPVGESARDPNELLPHVYRDATSGFFCWRDRWQDGDDTVITVLTNEVRGYMGAKADRSFALNSRSRQLRWGTVNGGPVRHWSASPRGQTSSLTLADGTGFAVDFSGASGANLMLVTTGKAEGQTVRVGDAEFTFCFPNTDRPPVIRVAADAVVVGGQRVTLTRGNLTLAVAGR
jgi:hypothetical protein